MTVMFIYKGGLIFLNYNNRAKHLFIKGFDFTRQRKSLISKVREKLCFYLILFLCVYENRLAGNI